MLTLELRWFAPGPLADHELRAFADDRQIEIRSDRYLLGTGEALGVKRRGAAGQLEHKRRLGHEPVEIAGAPALAGLVERWQKTWPAQTGPADGRWLAVDKRRALRRVGRCRAELTALTVAGLARPHLSVAVETGDDAPPALLAAAATLLREQPWLAARLVAARSCGYPAWIASLEA